MPVLVLFLVMGILFVIMGILSFSAVVAEKRQLEREKTEEEEQHPVVR